MCRYFFAEIEKNTDNSHYILIQGKAQVWNFE